MIYIVSGHARTGTSMMMKCLQQGPLEAVFNPDREKLNEAYGDDYYLPNPSGFWEVGSPMYMVPGFAQTLEDDTLVKIQYRGVPILPKGEYKIVFMWRDPVEIAQSLDAFFARTIPAEFPEWYEQTMDIVEGIMDVRADVEWMGLYYPGVINFPMGAFRKLRNAGWPIDVERAAAEVKEEYYRHRVNPEYRRHRAA